MLGLRLVKKTVNQDDPTVYHLFYADERGSAGADITFFEYPGAPTWARRRRDGPPRRLPGRLGGGARVLGAAASAATGVAVERTAGVLRRPGGARARARPSTTRRTTRSSRSTRRSRRSTRCRASTGVRAYTLGPGAQRVASSRKRLALRGDGSEARGDRARRLLRLRRAAGGAAASRGRDRAPRRVGLDDGRARGVARAGRARRRLADAGHRPLLLPLDVLPRAERGAVRDRDARAGLHTDEDPEHLGERLSLPPDYEHLRDR